MPPRKERITVVLDTNVVLGYYLSRSPSSASNRIFRLWRDERRLQLIVSNEVLDEYLEVLRRVNVDDARVSRLHDRLQQRVTVTWVNLGTRFNDSRDPDDNLLLATASAGRARFLVTNDRDLLDIPDEQTRRFRFQIVTPGRFLDEIGR